jgi:hypothetical protein
MGIDDRLKDLRGTGRRDFIKWSGTVAAVLGLERARFLNVLNDVGGTALADNSACTSSLRSFHLVAGNGGFAWFNLLFPQTVVATGTNPQYSFHAMGKAVKSAVTDNPLYYAPESPFQKLGKKFQISAFMCGNNETHTSTPMSAATPSNTASMLAGIAAIQQSNPTLLPVIAINPFTFGAAPGAPATAAVANSAGLVDLFNSAASKTLLQVPGDAALHEAYYKAFLGLNRAAGRSTVAKGFETGKVAANLLGKNLSEALRPTTADDAAYGIVAGTPTNVLEIAHAIITGIKAFKLGLTSSIIIPAMRDDPHGAFAGGDAMPTQMAGRLGKIFDAMMADASASPDPSCSSKSLADNLMMTIHGDTPKNPLNRNGWGDGTPKNSNWLYVLGNGYIKTGWFGGVNADGTTDGWDPATGKNVPNQASSVTAANGATAALYAAAKGDNRRVADFSRAVIDGIANPLAAVQ